MAICHCEAQTEFKRLLLLVDSLRIENAELKTLVEEHSNRDGSKFSKLEQECYSLQKKQEMQHNMVQSLEEEIEILKSEKASSEKRLREGHERVLREFHEQLTSLKSDLEMARSEGAGMGVLKAQLASVRKELEQQQQEALRQDIKAPEDASCSFNQHLVPSLQAENMRLVDESGEWSKKHERMAGEVRRMEGKVAELHGEIEGLTSTQEVLVTEKQALQGELRLLRARLHASQAKPDHLQGNSLFSEVEDRRVVVERKMMQMRAENEALRQSLKMSQELLNDAKTQDVWHWKGRSLEGYECRVEELERELEGMRTSLKHNNGFINRKQDELDFLVQRLQEQAVSVDPQKSYDVHYAFNNDKVADLSLELERQRNERLVCQDALSVMRRKLFSAQQELMRLRIKDTERGQEGMQSTNIHRGAQPPPEPL